MDRNKKPEEIAAERRDVEIAEKKKWSNTIEMASRMQYTDEKDAGYQDIKNVIKAQLTIAQSDYEIHVHSSVKEILKNGGEAYVARLASLETRMSDLQWFLGIPKDYRERADSYLEGKGSPSRFGRNPK